MRGGFKGDLHVGIHRRKLWVRREEELTQTAFLLQKPFKLDHLAAKIREVLGAASRR